MHDIQPRQNCNHRAVPRTASFSGRDRNVVKGMLTIVLRNVVKTAMSGQLKSSGLTDDTGHDKRFCET